MAQAYLARAAVLTVLREQANASIDGDVAMAMERGATTEEIAAALGLTRQAVEKRWVHLRRARRRVAVVISRCARIYRNDDDVRRYYGEVGGPDQYDSDRGAWPIGKAIRELARYAIVAVDGTVQRIYRIDPARWEPALAGKWQFTAVGNRECAPEEIEAAYSAGDLPLRPWRQLPHMAGRRLPSSLVLAITLTRSCQSRVPGSRNCRGRVLRWGACSSWNGSPRQRGAVLSRRAGPSRLRRPNDRAQQ
jgi:hypothetical protein